MSGLCSLLMLLGCQSAPKQPNLAVPPQITEFKDIGYFPEHSSRSIKSIKSDGKIYPGEWVALSGKGLTNAKLIIDEVTPAEVISSGHEQLLFRVPVGLNKYTHHQLVLTTAYGSATTEFYTHHYIIGTDTDYNRHNFMRLNGASKQEAESRVTEIDQTNPLFTMISPDSALLHSVGFEEKQEAPSGSIDYLMRINTINLLANDQPEVLDFHDITLPSTPTDAKLSHKNVMALLGKSHLILADASAKGDFAELARIELPQPPADTLGEGRVKENSYTDVEFVGERYLIILESRHNHVVLFDISQPSAPRMLSNSSVLSGAQWPSVVDLLPDNQQPDKFWLLAGRNLRNYGKKTVELFKDMISGDGDQIDDAKYSALISFHISGDTFHQQASITLPDNQIPFYSKQDEQGNIYVSAMDWQFNEFADEDAAWYMNIHKQLFSAVSMGKIYYVDTQSGATEISSHGLGVYYHMDYAPELGPVFSIVKIGGQMLPPFVALKWGFAIGEFGTYSYRNVSRKLLIPPYSLGRMVIQN